MSTSAPAPPHPSTSLAGVTSLVRRYPVTLAVAGITAAVSLPALGMPGLVRALEQIPQAIWRGQWWRLVSPMFVQGYGFRQFVFNLLGIVVAGAVVERAYGRWRWLAIYFAAGIAGIALTSLWFPHQTDSGSSAAVAGLIGAVGVMMVTRREAPPLPALGYGVFFAGYLTVLAFAATPVALTVGLALVAGLLLLRARAHGTALIAVTAGLLAAATVAMLAVGDVHGVGLAVGMLAAALAGLPRFRRDAAEAHT